MNRINRALVAMIFALMMFSSCLDGDDAAVVVLISSKEDLVSFRNSVNSGNTEYYAILTESFDISGEEWIPIGNTDYPYEGVFNGNGNTISGLTIDTDDNNQGLFGYLSGGYISNLTLENPQVQGGGSYVGAICGRVGTDGYIFSCNITDTTGSSASISGNKYVGGIVGDAGYSPLLECYNEAAVTATGGFGGGVAGYSSSSTVTNCYNKGDINGGGDCVGGVIGQAYNSNVIACYNEGEVYSTANYVGGVVGRISTSMIACYNTAAVEGVDNVGGVVGFATNFYPSTIEMVITSCYNTGTISNNTGAITGSNNIGEIVGENYPEATIEACYYLNGASNNGIGSDEFATGVSAISSINEGVSAMNNAITLEESIKTTYKYIVGTSTPTLTE